MKHGIILPTYVYNQERARLATAAMLSLGRTVKSEYADMHLCVMIRPPEIGYDYPDQTILTDTFKLQWTMQPVDISGTEQTLAYGTQQLFDQGMELVTWMGDDALFHPEWLLKLHQLIEDKPDSKAWSVYRSAYERVHVTLEEEQDYVNVTSICGHGFTVSAHEWQDWGVDWHQGHWSCHIGDTLDLLHAHERPGKRWVTRKSWVEHTGVEGVHCTKDIPEHAIDFQGEMR